MAHFNLYCTEDAWDDEKEDEYHHGSLCQHHESFHPQDSLCVRFTDDQIYPEPNELVSLFLKEKTQRNPIPDYPDSLSNSPLLPLARKESVEWLLSVSTHMGFTAQTAVLAVSYLDRFLSMQQPQIEKPWVPQLAAVACLSLAAKVEETRFPLLLDLQVEDTKYIFEPKTIKRMELLVLSALEWRMHQVTPLSFIDHIVRRLAVCTSSQPLGFFKRCEQLLLYLITDSRLVHFKPSIIASATMLHVINEVDRLNAMEYEEELLCAMGLKKDEVKHCLELVEDLVIVGIAQKSKPLPSLPGSPSGIFDVASFFSDSTNDSWASSSSSTAVEEEEELQENATKKRRLDDPPRPLFSSFGHMVVDIILGSP